MEDFENAIEKFVEEKSDSLKSDYGKAIKIPNKSVRNIPKEIIKSALKINKDEFSFDGIRLRINHQNIRSSELESKLNQLCQVEKGRNICI